MHILPANTETVRHDVAPPGGAFEDVRAYLESGAPWPGEPPPECIETHASLVFLTRDKVWKLKKPVRLIHVDQQSLETREHLCREELRLNRALSGDVYHSVTPIVRAPDGSLTLGGEGQIVDWLVESDRLPADQMLDRRLVCGPQPELSEVEALCNVLTGFYRRQPKQPDAGSDFHLRLRQDYQIAATHLPEMASSTHVPVPDSVLDYAGKTLEACRTEIVERGRQGLVVEGHGDLRAEHVCLTKPPVVFDRLEINHGVRLLDPFFEINALGLECALLGAGWIRATLLVKLSQSMTPPSCGLLTAYGLVASLTRARFAADHFRDSEVATPDKWRRKTRQGIAIAEQLVARARQN